MKYGKVVEILLGHGFVLDRQQGSHRQYEGVVGGRRRLVTIPGKNHEDAPRGTLASIIRQSGLPKRLFR